MGPIEEALTQQFFPALFGELDPGEKDKWREVWGHSVKRAGLGIPDPTKAAEHCHSTSVESCLVLVTSILEQQELEYGAHQQY
eukprot:12825169-Ditylum_brightwellii.AAC.1